MKITRFIVVALGALVIWADNAQAYIDPGAGSMIIQALLAALIGVGVFIRQARTAIAAFFKRLMGKSGEKTGDD